MVVDNNPVFTRLVSEIIKKRGCSVRTAEDGLVALNILEEYIPDIIFVDLIMPNISGEILCHAIRSKVHLKDSYIIILSGVAAEADLDLKKLGADACIAKGKQQHIATHVNVILDKIEGGVLREEQHKNYGLEDIFVREATVELLDTKSHLEVVLANMSDGLVEITSNGIITSANPAAEILLSMPQIELLGSNLVKFFREEDQQTITRLFDSSQLTFQSPPHEARGFNLNKRYVALQILALGNCLHSPSIVIMQDFTERKIAEDALRKSEEHYRDLIESTSDMVQNIAPDGRFLYVNNAWKNVLGYTERDLQNLIIRDVLDPEQFDKCMLKFSDVIKGGKITDIETAFIAKDGRRVQVLGSASCKFANDKPIYTRGIFHDITERKLLERELQSNLNDFKAIFNNTLVGIVHTSADRKVIRLNKRMAEILGYSQEELIGKSTRSWHVSEEDYIKAGILYSDKRSHAGKIHMEFPYLRKDGNVIWGLVSGKALDPENLEKGFISIVDDISERKELEERLKLLSTTDQLTGAYNRRAFEDIFSQEMNRVKRYQEPLSLILFDIDHFKKVNDTLGHDLGDRVLQEVTKVGREQIRQIDSFVRWGGEEFLLLLPNTGIEKGRELAERLRAAVENYDFSLPWKLTISLGVSQFQQEDSAETIIKRADNALYEAKDGGRNRVVTASL